MKDTTWERLGAATGIVSVLLFVGAFAVAPESPEIGTATDQEIRSYFVDHSMDLRLSVVLVAASSLFLLWFLGSLRARLVAAEGAPGRLAPIAFGAGLLTVATYLVTAGQLVEGVGSSAKMATYDAATLRSILITSELAWGAVGVGTLTRAALLGAASLVALRFGGLPKWLGWVGALFAAGSFVGIFTLLGANPTEDGPLDTVWFLSWLAFNLWVLLASIVLVARPPAPRAVAPASGSPPA
jgi:hypothetical protein